MAIVERWSLSPSTSVGKGSIEIPRQKKALGQVFLISPGKSRTIVDALGIAEGDTVIEIGPGSGALTRILMEKRPLLFPVEVDLDLLPHLSELSIGDCATFPIIADFLTFDIAKFAAVHSSFSVVGNLPYFITSPIIMRLIPFVSNIRSMVFMVQKEVGDRLLAEPGQSEYGLLTVACGIFFDLKHVVDVGAGEFRPRPKVDSTVVKFVPKREIPSIEYRRFVGFLKTCFAMKRKKLTNNLRIFDSKRVASAFESNGVAPGCRAEELTPELFAGLYRSLVLNEAG